MTRSSEEAKFKVMAHDNCELLWLKIILTNLKIKIKETMMLYCDNKDKYGS